jgi:hypothetical protein
LLPAPPSDPAHVTVTGAGTTFVHDPNHGDGWDFDSTKQLISVYGNSCNTILNGPITTLDVMVPCP